MTLADFEAHVAALKAAKHLDVGVAGNDTTMTSLIEWMRQGGYTKGPMHDASRAMLKGGVPLLEVEELPDYVVELVCACQVCAASGMTPDYATSPIRVHHRYQMRDGTLTEMQS